jgi:hypothetical protein
MLRESIMQLKLLLQSNLPPQQDKEVRAELSELEDQLRLENFLNKLNNGISTYGSYFEPYSNIKIDSYHK